MVMVTPERFGLTLDPQASKGAGRGRAEGFESALGTATRWAHTVGSGLGATRHWVESEAIGNRPLITLGLAFGLGVLTGWLVKRR
jgi:hypothetical protein